MLQRPQTLLLLVVILAMSMTAFGPLWIYESEKVSASIDIITIKSQPGGEASAAYLAAVAGLSVLLALYSISQFKKRTLQIVVGAVNNLVITSFLLLGSFVAISKASELANITEGGQFQWTFFLPAIAILANFIASKLIRKDDNLVKSMDRMR